MNGQTLKRTALAAGLAALVVVSLAAPAWATNGYFTHGYGTKNKGLGGAGVAYAQDAMTVATNPAGLAFVGKRYEIGVGVFSPDRSYTVHGNPSGYPGTFGLRPGKVTSGSKTFYVPHFAAGWELKGDNVIGIAIYGHGGMNTDYGTQTFGDPFSSSTGVNLEQLFVAPTWAKAFGGKHAIGITPVFVYQSFEAKGVQSFGGFSSAPLKLSNNGASTTTGYGVKLGYLGQFTDKFSFGLSYQSKMDMGTFGDYAGLFAEQGGFDVPSTWTAGIAVKASEAFTILFDFQQILYTDVASVSNPFENLFQAFQGDPSYLLGGNNGPGFGWEDMSIFKLGFQYASGNAWTWRFGASMTDQPIPSSEVLFNILAPGVMEQHYTFGFTKDIGDSKGLNFALMYAPSVTVTGPNPLEAPDQQTISLEMTQWEAELSFAWGF